MAIAFTCSECDEDLRVKDALAGRKIKCPHCGEVIPVPADDERRTSAITKERPKKAPPPDEDDVGDDERPRKGKKKKKKPQSNTGLIIGISAGVGVVVIGGIVAAVLLLPKREEPKPIARVPVPEVHVEPPKEEPKPDLNKVDIGKGKRQETSVRARIHRPARLNELRNIAQYYQTFRSEQGKSPKNAEEFLKYIHLDPGPIKKAIKERYYVVVSNVSEGIVAYEHDPDNTGQHGCVDMSAAVTNMTTQELEAQLKKQGSWTLEDNRPRK